MFRPLKTPFYNAFLEASVFTNTASAQTFALGADQWASAATATSVTTLTAKETYGQAMLGAASPGDDIADAATVTRSVVGTSSAVTLVAKDTAVAAVDVGDIHYLNFASRDDESQIITETHLGGALYPVKCRQGQAHVILGRVLENSGTYSIAYGSSEFSITDTGTGRVSVSLTRGFHSPPCVVIIPKESSRCARVSSVTSTGFDVILEDAGSTAADAPFDFVVMGFKAPDVFHDGFGRSVLINGRRPRLVAAKLTNQTTASIGSGLITSASGGTGIYDITFTQPFAQPPVVLAMTQDTAGNGAWTAIETASTASTVSVISFAQNGAATTPDELELLVFGFDSADVY